RSAFSRDLGGDALINIRRQARIDEDCRFRLAQHIDEAGSDDFALGVNRKLARGRREIADGGDTAVADSDVAGIPGRARTVHDVSVGDDEVEDWVGGKGKSRENQ